MEEVSEFVTLATEQSTLEESSSYVEDREEELPEEHQLRTRMRKLGLMKRALIKNLSLLTLANSAD